MSFLVSVGYRSNGSSAVYQGLLPVYGGARCVGIGLNRFISVGSSVLSVFSSVCSQIWPIMVSLTRYIVALTSIDYRCICLLIRSLVILASLWVRISVYEGDIAEVSIDIYRSMPSIDRSISVCSVSKWL